MGDPALAKISQKKFVELNSSLEGFSHALPSDVLSDARAFIRHALERYTQALDDTYIQGVLKWSFLLDNWRFGPGASHEVSGTHTAEKLAEVMTCTMESEPLVRILRSSNPHFSSWDAAHGSCGVKTIRGSKLATVPKNEDTERTIAIEPSGNMALQLAAGRYLENALKAIGLDIRKQQPRNKALAQLGSLNGSFCTIDLASASDRISPSLVRALFPSEWCRLLFMLRSPDIYHDGQWHRLNMISTMGNGYTFPLMTLIITSLVYANRVRQGGPDNLWLDWSRTAVFGDDIIVPTSEFESLCQVLEAGGFVVNRDKSFHDGSFRESCGGDYDYGVDITPFYVKDLLQDASVYVAINQALLWSARHKPLFRTITYLRSLLPRGGSQVPEWEDATAGIRTRGCPRRYVKLMPTKVRRVLRQDVELHFGTCLAAGAYITSSGDRSVFLPRLKQVRYGTRKSRLPRGYLDGRSADYCTDAESRDIERLIAFTA
jgi:hypothetical protein